MKGCVTCRKPFEAGDSKLMHIECSHRTHQKCLDVPFKPTDEELKKCGHCRGVIDLTRPLVPLIEPRPADGIDYVLRYTPPAAATVVKQPETNPSLPKLFGSLLRRNYDDEDETPREKTELEMVYAGPQDFPIDYMILRRKKGLQHMLKAGVKLTDYLNSGYTYSNLCAYRDIGNGTRDGFAPVGVLDEHLDEKSDAFTEATEGQRDRARKVLVALGMTMEHFKSYPDKWPFQQIRDALDISPLHMSELYGLRFPKQAELYCHGSNRVWRASDLVDFGWKYEDLIRAGMTSLNQYLALEPSDLDAAALGATPEKLARLAIYVKPSEVPVPAATAANSMATVAQPQVIVSASPQYQVQVQQQQQLPRERIHVLPGNVVPSFASYSRPPPGSIEVEVPIHMINRRNQMLHQLKE